MKIILFPTDFSPSADNALSYATGLCEAMNAKLVLLHAWHVPAFATQVPSETFSEEKVRAEASAHFQKYKANRLLKGHKITVEEHVKSGFAVDTIVSEAKECKADLIVMGTKGASGLEEVFIGSNTASVMEKAPCPVLAVPADAKFHPPKKIAFATNYSGNDFDALKFIASIASPFQAELVVVHISNIIADDYQEDLLNILKEKVEKEVHYKNITFDSFTGDSVTDALNSFSHLNKIDLVALAMRKRNLISRLFDRSLTKKMAYHTHIPLLSVHG